MLICVFFVIYVFACAWKTCEQQLIQYANENVCVYLNARVFLSVRLFAGKRVGGRGGSKGKHYTSNFLSVSKRHTVR